MLKKNNKMKYSHVSCLLNRDI